MNKFPFTGLIYSIYYWGGNDKFMHKVTFPLRLVTFPGCTMTFTQATSLESKLVFRRNTGLGSMRHVARGQAGKHNLTGCCSMPYSGNTQLWSAHILTTSSQWATLRTFIGWDFVGNCAIRNSYDGSRKISTSNRAAVTKPDWWGLGSRRNYSLWHLVISFVCVCIMFLIISILLILFPS